MAGTLDPHALRHTHEVRPLFLIGFMGAGKTTVGRLVAERLGRPFRDLDDAVQAETGTSVAEIFATSGEAGFRAAERAALETVASQPDVVCACGGGAVTDPASRAVLESSGDVVYLVVSPEDALARCGSDATVRPLLGEGLESAAGLLASRRQLYEETADVAIGTTGRTPPQVADAIVEWMGR